MATESPEMERRTSFARRLSRDSAAPQASPQFRDQGEPLPSSAWEAGRETRETEEKKNESSHCNNCSGSIIPTLEQIMLICVSMCLGWEPLNVAYDPQ